MYLSKPGGRKEEGPSSLHSRELGPRRSLICLSTPSDLKAAKILVRSLGTFILVRGLPPVFRATPAAHEGMLQRRSLLVSPEQGRLMSQCPVLVHGH